MQLDSLNRAYPIGLVSTAFEYAVHLSMGLVECLSSLSQFHLFLDEYLQKCKCAHLKK